MYNPAPFGEDRPEELHKLIRQHPLAVIVACGPDGPEATHAPMALHPEIGQKGVLRCHFARANPQWKMMESSPSVLAIFQGPEHYITPSWYASKQEHGKVVPTWNYAVVHVRGQARLFQEAELLEHLRALTGRNEEVFEEPWSIDDAPPEYIQAMSRAIVGVEITIESIEGKWKASQNRPEADRRGVVTGLTRIGSDDSLAMAELVKERGLE